MIKPETSDFFGNELDKAKLEIASYWKDKYEKTQEALDIARDALKEIDKTRCGVDVNLYAVNHKLLKAGNVFCWTTPDEIHNTLDEITAIEQKDGK